MASSYTTSLKIQEIGNGEQSGVWGSSTNTNWQLIEQAVAGVQTITMANANYTLTNLNGLLDEARNMVLVVQGTNSGVYQIIIPANQSKFYIVSNQTTGGYAITIGTTGVGGSVISIPNGTTAQVYTDGTNTYSAQTGSAGDFKVNGNFTVTGNQTDTGNLTVGGNFTANNSASFAVSPTAPTPSVGDNSTKLATTAFVTTATSGLGTMATQNANAVAITGGTITGSYGLTASNVSGTVAVVNGGTGTTTSTGSGSVVLGTSPTITTPTVATVKSAASLTPTVFQDSGGTQIGVLCRAWCQYSGTTQTINGNFNLNNVVRNSTGLYTFNFTNAMPNANYATTYGISYDLTTGGGNNFAKIVYQSTTAVQIQVLTTGGNPVDCAYLAISVFA